MIEDSSKLSHLRYGHLGFVGLNLLSKKRMVDDLPSIVDSYDKCEACIWVSNIGFPLILEILEGLEHH